MLTRVFLLFVCVAAVSARGGAPDLTQDDYDIWHAAIQGHDPRRVVYVWHTIEPLEALQRITLETALKDFPEARPTANTWQLDAAELDLQLLNAAAARHSLPFGGGSRYALLDLDALEQLVEITTPPKPNWILNPMLLPDADSVCRLTRPVIRSDGRVAYLYYMISTQWWGAVESCSLHRDTRDGTWQVDSCGRTDFTDWKDGKRIYEDEKAAHPCSCH